MFFSDRHEFKSPAEEKSPNVLSPDAPADTLDAVDMAVLNGLEAAQVDGEPDIVVELMELYLADAAVKLAAMRERLAEKEGRLLARLAHSLRGSSASLGARRAAALCEQLERTGEGDPPGSAEMLLNSLELELACVRNVFEAECRRRS